MKPSSVTIRKKSGLVSWFKNRWKTRPAETLVEVIIAIFVMATGSAAATTLIVTAIQANSFSRDNLIALNLAVEGVEAVRNIRDTNWLKFGYDKEHCWNMDPQEDTCDNGDLIPAGNYRLDLDVSTMRWLLTPPTSTTGTQDSALEITNPVLDTSKKEYQLKYVDLNTGDDSNGDGNTSNDRDLYVSGAPDPVVLAALTGDVSPFYRMVKIEYSADPPTNDEMTVTSVVQWRAQNHVSQVVLKTKLTNYQKM